MCLGGSLLHRVSRIAYACPDPHGGAMKIDPNVLGMFYANKWPKIEDGLFREDSYKLMTQFMRRQNTKLWKEILGMFEKMHDSW
jgi:tRNA(Arg) A34 adenosine deaminase TadA